MEIHFTRKAGEASDVGRTVRHNLSPNVHNFYPDLLPS